MKSSPDEPNCARGLAVDHIERALTMQANEHLSRKREPDRVAPRQPLVSLGRVDIVPARAVALLADDSAGMARCHDINLMSAIREALRESSRMVLHPADAVARDRDDADPHG